MADFLDTRDQLTSTRAQAESLRLSTLSATQQIKMLRYQLDTLERQKTDNGEFYLQKKTALEEDLKKTSARLEKDRAGLNQSKEKLQGLEKDFELFFDPRKQLADHFSNDTPFMLFPLRIETRFKQTGDQPQLWVRVYPDESLIDSFEPLLSQKEVNNAARFWAEFYSCGKPADPLNPDPATKNLELAAWALLVKAHGSGRAAYITRQIIPDTSFSVFPLRSDKTVILSIIVSSWKAENTAPVAELYRKLWLANGAQDLIDNIKKNFNQANPGLDMDQVMTDWMPVNFDQAPPQGVKREDADIQLAVVIVPDLDKKAGKEHSWSQASRVTLLPERLALILFNGNVAKEPVFGSTITYPLYTSPDPNDTGAQLKQTDSGDLEFGESIRWLADFDRAISCGMGFKVNLSPEETRGFSRLLILGVKLGADSKSGQQAVQELFQHHYFSQKGFSVLPQGTPTNNTANSDAGYSSRETPEESFDRLFLQKPAYDISSAWSEKKDGQWLSEWLGFDQAFGQQLLHAETADQSDAMNMSQALWPATMGNVMESLMKGGFDEATISRARNFCTKYVSGRGPIPAVRIGNQPYGILPTTAFNRLRWLNPDIGIRHNIFGQSDFLFRLYQLLLKLENFIRQQFWGQLPHIGQPGADPYKTLLEVIGLHPNSVSWHRRYFETLIEMSNSMSLIKPGFMQHSKQVRDTVDFLHNTLGYDTDIMPQLAALLGLPLTAPVKFMVDDLPLSETNPVRSYSADNKNYLQVLAEQARVSIDAVRTGKGLSEHPQAELYRLIKYAIELSYHHTGVRAATEVAAISPEVAAAMKVQEPFLHQQYAGKLQSSQYEFLYKILPALSDKMSVADYVSDSLLKAVIPAFSQDLADLLNSLDSLKNISTARLERAMVEHLDCCTYRLDSWKTGIIGTQLSIMRGIHDGASQETRKTGLYIGAFGWLENVRPNPKKKITPVELPADLQMDFNPNNQLQFLKDASNEGFIHAPSLNQGVTAAVLRNGYLAHGKVDGNNIISVDLSSQRIRTALTVIEGIQGGQSLAALLGYHFERELHDRDDLKAKKIDSYIYALRKKFPLVADQMKETLSSATADPSVDPQTIPITAIEARNVIHSTHLIEHVKKQTVPANQVYPFGLTGLPSGDASIASAITDAVNHIMNIADALADLGIAESVHHVLMGNVDRAAGVLDSFSKGNYPQEPDVTRTPRSGATLTHRVGVPFTYINLSAGAGPRKQAEPSMNAWLEKVLPSTNSIVCSAGYVSRANGAKHSLQLSMKELGFDPIDLIYLIGTAEALQFTELEDRVLHYVTRHRDPVLDQPVTIEYTAEPSNDSLQSFFQALPMLRSLRQLMLESKDLNPGDMAMPNEISQKDLPPAELPLQRLTGIATDLKNVITSAKQPANIAGYLNALPDLSTATDPQLQTVLDLSDETIDGSADFLLVLESFGIPGTEISGLYAQRQQIFVSLKTQLIAVRDRWQKANDDYMALVADPVLNEEKLQAMERLISVALTPAETITLSIVQNKKLAFDNMFSQLQNVVISRMDKLSVLFQQTVSLDLKTSDVVPFDVTEFRNDAIRMIYDLKSRINGLLNTIQSKIFVPVDSFVTAYPSLKITEQADKLQSTARLILGDSFRMIPKFSLPASQKAEINNSWNATSDLLAFASTTRLNPVEDWLFGIARVHEKMKSVESLLLLREAFALDENDFALHPLQFPFSTTDYHWLALPYPNTVDLEKGNRLLFTVVGSNISSSPAELCGVLIDEWTELIPAKEETTGLTFHYDRPNSEAPQTMLLVTPTQLTGNWNWNDLVDALINTLDSARLRAVQPDLLEKTPLGSLLPAIIATESMFPYSIVFDNNAHYLTLEQVRNFQTIMN